MTPSVKLTVSDGSRAINFTPVSLTPPPCQADTPVFPDDPIRGPVLCQPAHQLQQARSHSPARVDPRSRRKREASRESRPLQGFRASYSQVRWYEGTRPGGFLRKPAGTQSQVRIRQEARGFWCHGALPHCGPAIELRPSTPPRAAHLKSVALRRLVMPRHFSLNSSQQSTTNSHGQKDTRRARARRRGPARCQQGALCAAPADGVRAARARAARVWAW